VIIQIAFAKIVENSFQPQQKKKTVVVKKTEVSSTITGPEFLGSVETGEGSGGFTIDPKTGEKKYNLKQPPNVKK